MSEQLSKQISDTAGKIAIVGDRELVIGYRLIGIDDTFIIDSDEASKKVQELYSSGEFGLIIASDSARSSLPITFLSSIEESIEPLVLFMPSQTENKEEESIAALAKRILGIKIEVS